MIKRGAELAKFPKCRTQQLKHRQMVQRATEALTAVLDAAMEARDQRGEEKLNWESREEYQYSDDVFNA